LLKRHHAKGERAEVEKAAEARENDQERKQKQVDEQRQKDWTQLLW
jgi:hypothetical protein